MHVQDKLEHTIESLFANALTAKSGKETSKLRDKLFPGHLIPE